MISHYNQQFPVGFNVLGGPHAFGNRVPALYEWILMFGKPICGYFQPRWLQVILKGQLPTFSQNVMMKPPNHQQTSCKDGIFEKKNRLVATFSFCTCDVYSINQHSQVVTGFPQHSRLRSIAHHVWSNLSAQPPLGCHFVPWKSLATTSCGGWTNPSEKYAKVKMGWKSSPTSFGWK